MKSLLDSAKEISNSEYLLLKNPIFKAQSACDAEKKYWVIFESDGVKYKIQCNLF